MELDGAVCNDGKSGTPGTTQSLARDRVAVRSARLHRLGRRVGWPIAIAASSLLHYSGLLGLYQRCRRRPKTPRILILGYHRVSDDRDSCRNLCVSPRNFRRHMEYVANSPYRPISLTTVLDYLEGRVELEGDSIAITFDDGYRDVYTNAFPILQEFGLPATVFVISGLLDAQETPWWDRLAGVVASLGRGRTSPPNGHVPRELWEHVVAVARGGPSRTSELIESFKSQDGAWREEVLAGLEAAVPPAVERPRMLTWDMVRQMRQHAISFGAHTVTHPLLSRIDRDQVTRELRESKARVEEILGEEVPFFAYPNGSPADFTRRTIASVREAGFRLAVTLEAGVNSYNENPLSLKRYGVLDVPAYALATRLHLLR